MNNENCFYTIVIIVFAVVIALGYLLFTSEGNEAMKLCKVIVCVLAVACLSLMYYCYSNHKKCERSNQITEKMVECWIKEAVKESLPIKIDDVVVSKIEELKNQCLNSDKALHDELEKVFFTKNSNLKFLQEMAHSIGKEASSWTTIQIERFLQCYEVTKEALKKEMDL